MPGDGGALAVAVVQFRFDPFDVPVAEIVPEKLINALHRFVKTLRFERVLNRLQRVGKTREKPCVDQRHAAAKLIRCLLANFRRSNLFQLCAALLKFVQIHEQKARRIPDLVRKGTRAKQTIFRNDDVGSRSGHGSKTEAHRVRAVFLVQRDRIEPGTLRFGHLFAARGAHERMQVHGAKRDFPGEVDAHHDHSRHPEKQNVVCGDQQARRIVRLKIGCLFGPAERRERPQRRAEPGV